MAILYSLVARGNVVLVEYANATGNFALVTRAILEKMPPQASPVPLKKSYQYDRQTFHFILVSGITYLCMTEQSFPRRLTFAFLEDVKSKFTGMFSDAVVQSAATFGLTNEFERVLKGQMDFYSKNPEADQFYPVKKQVDEIKHIMVESIDNLLDRSERIDLMVTKAAGMEETTYTFERDSGRLRFWEKVRRIRCWILTFTVIALIIIILVCVMVLYLTR
mmetsp:Transcript_13650/g.34829  ORF Transcript_13650/g.34829 Transcript_13650/m.34829 type:complete len:220 (+) Transcript_13650:233-892(+)|eukprot:CAMPEP_0177668182 /NCGR_PEP_ID=MMETSP0447-20121125/22601_1 /TAXON_ID=0 /ORGANISM="Stygamoeba regulata, Strain BSH-02190019" /LENGTH=219 /DNA_ID=CAMNT_0019174625 /DNA_START=161 /DNA_END=820 /DNA_ORIENTATION=+